jgi:hypothetical protein
MSQKPPTQNKILVLETKKQETGAAEETARLAGESEDVILQDVDEPGESNMEEEGSQESLGEENREEEGSQEGNSEKEDEGDDTQPEGESGRSSLKEQDDKTTPHGYEHDYKVWSLKIQFTGGKHHLYLYVATETLAGSRKCPDDVCIKNFHG